MKKIVIQGFAIVLLFFSTWFLLSQIDWMTLFDVEKNSEKTEEKLGELLLDVFTSRDTEVTTPVVVKSVDSMVSKICLKNNINSKLIKVHIIQKDDVNAFALPNGHLVLYSGLILEADSPESLAGVIAHEIAHIERNHVMKKLIKEIGLSVLISITTGNSGGQIIKETAKTLSSTAFDRSLEKEADLQAVDYLSNAHISAEPFANFLYKLGDEQEEIMQYLTWVNTHPDSKERAEYIIEYSADIASDIEPIIIESSWTQLKMALEAF